MIFRRAGFLTGICLTLTSWSAWAASEWSPLQILQRALKHYPGRIVEMEQITCKPRRCIMVKLLTPNSQVRKLVFRADTGKLLKDELQTSTPSKQLGRKGLVPLDQLVKRFKNGRLLEVELEFEKGQLVYEVEWLDANGKVWEQLFDAYTGKMIQSHGDD